MRTLLIFLITFYQKFLSPDQGFLVKMGFIRRSFCVFYPTCSEYSKIALRKHGVLKGVYISLKRLLRCHPFQKQYIDEVI